MMMRQHGSMVREILFVLQRILKIIVHGKSFVTKKFHQSWGKLLVLLPHLPPHLAVEIMFKPNKDFVNRHGTFDINFNNIIFNSTGYMTHDRAITNNEISS